ncbi:alpha/beta fold hydrolase [Winogradskyella vincentii]|uniref:Alpha/beta hydrolase n=1 Tax=Winogradskyella vincentii TaxID=2877122 RepID=A0ABS7Y0Z7_9FLAO|nr:alpha/beta hydrolase [Winogradskyella vincentii]MCA0152517.1 alpha/beta hydrolase [Winogradskyella vincentii]
MILHYKNSEIHFNVKGEGKPLLLLHGFLESKEMWEKLMPLFSAKSKVISIDLLGHGKTDSIGYIHTMEDMARCVFAVLKHLKVKSVKVIGHSMGGYVALALADLYPNLVSDLCLMNSTFEDDSEERKKLRLRAVEMARTNYERLVRTSFTSLFAPESKERFKSKYNDALKVALKTPVQGYIAAQRGMAQRNRRLTVFKDIQGKKEILIGKKDNLVNSEALSKLIKNTPIELVELSEGHMSHIENKSDLSYFLLRFIEK